MVEKWNGRDGMPELLGALRRYYVTLLCASVPQFVLTIAWITCYRGASKLTITENTS